MNKAEERRREQQQKRDETYVQWQRIIRRDGSRCRAGLPDCTVAATDRHHVKPKGRGGSDEDRNIILVCRICHNRIHAHPERSSRAGFLLHSWEAEGQGGIRGAAFWTEGE